MAAEAQHYDRDAEDLGNIVGLEHVNLQIPDQNLGTAFYVSGLGLTRDPYMNTGLANMWINVGKSQFHLPTGEPWVLRGAIGLVTPDRATLLKRLDNVKKALAGTQFAVQETNDCVAVTCPWGNRFNMHTPDEARFAPSAWACPISNSRCRWAPRKASPNSTRKFSTPRPASRARVRTGSRAS